jgi:CheY-like chemotaxis protein
MKPIKILLVEDNPGDVDLTREVLDASGRDVDLHVAEDGVLALECLEHRTDRAANYTPDLILLDLNLPRLDGRKVLAHIKGTERLKAVPVVILTSSDAEDDVLESYQLGANSYVMKPTNLKTYRSTVQGVETFWSRIATLPPNDDE